MLQLAQLRQLCKSEHSGVSAVKKQIHLALEPSYSSDINYGILKCLDSHLQEYYPEVSGILLGYDQVKLKKSAGAMHSEQPHIHIDIQATFFIFCPSTGKFLLGTVNKKSSGHVGVLVHDTFTAAILKSGDTPVKSWAGDKVAVGKVVRFKVLSVSYSMNRVVLLGELDSETMTVREKEVVVGIIEQVSDFEGNSDHDSGIENGHKGKSKEVLAASDSVVTGESSGASGSKRKPEEEAEDAVERKKRRKAVKRARKEKERQEMESSKQEDSSNEFQADKSRRESSFTAVLEPDLLAPKSSKDKPSLLSPKTPKTPKDNFELPDDFKVIERKTDKNSWKIYQGPDGKNYRSMAEVKRHLESCTYNTKNLAETIAFVATDWNCADSGELAADKNKYYAADVKDFPKTSLYFTDIKPNKSSNTLEIFAVEAKINDKSQDRDRTEETVHKDIVDSSVEKKKKKKKKNKSKASS